MENSEDSNLCNTAIQARSSSNVALKHIKALQSYKKKQSYMPFVFKNKKQTNASNMSPSPGQYLSKSSFSLKNSRDVLRQNYNIELKNTKKIKQNVFFKSTAKRFNYKQQANQIPICYSYRNSATNNIVTQNLHKSQLKRIREQNRMMHKSLVNFQQRNLCPSIPDYSNKFGYILNDQGKLKKINKTDQQLFKQRQEMRKYVHLLNQQNKLNINLTNFNIEQRKQKQELLEKLKKKFSQSSSNVSLQNITKQQVIKKPIHEMSSVCNKNKLIRIFAQKKYLSQNLGPGCYNAQPSLGKKYKPERYQFFSSTSQRFSSPSYQYGNDKDKNFMKKIQIQNKLVEAKKQKYINYRKSNKKTHKEGQIKQMYLKYKLIQPGPGDYNPNQNIMKPKLAKLNSFNKSIRFTNLKKEKQNIDKTQKKNNLRGNYIAMFQLNKKMPKYTCQIIQKNKQILKNKKQLIQYTYKRYITRGQSEYPLCSWDSHSFSRTDMLPSLLKEEVKNQN